MKSKLTYLFSAGAIFISILACGNSDDGTDPNQPGSSYQMCGGIAGFQCDDPDEICVQDVGMCNVADASGTCQEETRICTKEYAPVCGCDGQTYGNACEAKVAGASVEHEGECAPSAQVCGTRGAMACSNGEVCIHPESANCGRADAPGSCQTPPQFCTQDYTPVCGCDGNTYSNECHAHSAGVSVDFTGECPSSGGDTTCGGFAGTTCAADEYCQYDQAATCGWADATGTCQTKPQICPQHEAPVCGCDGNTYGNSCKAAAAGTSVVSQGPCNMSGSN